MVRFKWSSTGFSLGLPTAGWKWLASLASPHLQLRFLWLCLGLFILLFIFPRMLGFLLHLVLHGVSQVMWGIHDGFFMFIDKFCEAFLTYAEVAANCCLGYIDERTFGVISGVADFLGLWPVTVAPTVLTTTTTAPVLAASALAPSPAPWWPARAPQAPSSSPWISSSRSASTAPRRGHAILDSLDFFATGFLLYRHFRPYDDAVAPVA